MATLQSRIASLIVSPRLAATRRRVVDWRARLTGATPEITLYYQVGDAYSSLCAQLLPTLRERLGAALRVVVVPTVADASNAAPELAPAYGILDASRIAPAWNLDFPANALQPGQRVREAAERVLLAAQDIDLFLETEPQINAALWRDDARTLEKMSALPPETARRRLRENYQELKDRGHYQGGMWHFRGEWYWGVDRLAYLEQRLRELGLVTGTTPLAELKPERARLPGIDPEAPLNFYFSFRSPYSYLAVDRVGELTRRHGRDLQIRPVLPMVMRGLKVPREKRFYIVRDAKREADSRGIPFGLLADPLGGGVERCLAVYPQAAEAGRGLEFLAQVGRAIWSEGADVCRDAVFAQVLERAGLPASLTDIHYRNADLDYAEDNREALFALGLWGVPSFQLGDFAVWGQDRLWLVDEALRRAEN